MLLSSNIQLIDWLGYTGTINILQVLSCLCNRGLHGPGPARAGPGRAGPGRADNLLISNGPGLAEFFAGRAGKFRPVHGP